MTVTDLWVGVGGGVALPLGEGRENVVVVIGICSGDAHQVTPRDVLVPINHLLQAGVEAEVCVHEYGHFLATRVDLTTGFNSVDAP